MKKWLTLVLLLATMGGTLMFCGSPPELLCCEEVGEFGDVTRSFCNDYVVATSDFLTDPTLEPEPKERQELFGRFLAQLRSCTTMSCITDAVDNTTLVPDFDSFFYDWHETALTRGIDDEAEQVRLLLCGIEHGYNATID